MGNIESKEFKEEEGLRVMEEGFVIGEDDGHLIGGEVSGELDEESEFIFFGIFRLRGIDFKRSEYIVEGVEVSWDERIKEVSELELEE